MNQNILEKGVQLPGLIKDPDFFNIMWSGIMEVDFFYLIPIHGFLTLQSQTIVNYLVDEEYSSDHEVSIKWDSVEDVRELITKMTSGFTFKLKMSDKDSDGINFSEL